MDTEDGGFDVYEYRAKLKSAKKNQDEKTTPEIKVPEPNWASKLRFEEDVELPGLEHLVGVLNVLCWVSVIIFVRLIVVGSLSWDDAWGKALFILTSILVLCYCFFAYGYLFDENGSLLNTSSFASPEEAEIIINNVIESEPTLSFVTVGQEKRLYE